MPSHLSTIGFPVETEVDLVRLTDQISSVATEMPVKDGKYLYWRGPAGEELWLQIGRSHELIGLNPHFSGASRMRIGLVARVNRSDDTNLECAMDACAAPQGDSPLEGAYPFVFDTPDCALYSDIETPCIAEAQIAAFAHEVEYFTSEEDFQASQAESEVHYASRSFIPAGLFRQPDDDSPSAFAVFTGEVLRAATYVNPVSNVPFYWALVDTFGGQFDVVIDPILLERQPQVGGFVSGYFWLSGRLVSYPRRKSGWLQRLFGGVN